MPSLSKTGSERVANAHEKEMNLQDGIFGRNVRISEERWSHILSNHPEMQGQYLKLKETLLNPDRIVSSNSDPSVNLYYRKYSTELVGEKYYVGARL